MPPRAFERLTDEMCLERPPTTGPGAGVGSLLDDDEPLPAVPAAPRSVAAATDVTEASEVVFLDGAICVEVESMAAMCRLVPFVPDEEVRALKTWRALAIFIAVATMWAMRLMREVRARRISSRIFSGKHVVFRMCS